MGKIVCVWVGGGGGGGGGGVKVGETPCNVVASTPSIAWIGTLFKTTAD